MSAERTDVADPVGRLREHAVAGEVADLVVDRLEVVEVEHDEREAAAVALRARHLPRERLVEVAPVVEAGERVEVGELARLAEAAGVLDRRAGAARELLELGRAGVAEAPPAACASTPRASRAARRGSQAAPPRRRGSARPRRHARAVVVLDRDRARLRSVRRARDRAAPARRGRGRSRRRGPRSPSPTLTMTASTPRSAPAASSVRATTSSRSIEPPSSPSTRLRRFSSCARSSASARSRTIVCIRSSICAATAFSFVSAEPAERRPSSEHRDDEDGRGEGRTAGNRESLSWRVRPVPPQMPHCKRALTSRSMARKLVKRPRPARLPRSRVFATIRCPVGRVCACPADRCCVSRQRAVRDPGEHACRQSTSSSARAGRRRRARRRRLRCGVRRRSGASARASTRRRRRSRTRRCGRSRACG